MNTPLTSNYFYASDFGPEFELIKRPTAQEGEYNSFFVRVDDEGEIVSMYGCKDVDPRRGSPVTKVI